MHIAMLNSESRNHELVIIITFTEYIVSWHSIFNDLPKLNDIQAKTEHKSIFCFLLTEYNNIFLTFKSCNTKVSVASNFSFCFLNLDFILITLMKSRYYWKNNYEEKKK